MLMDFFRRNEKLVHWVLLPAVVVPFIFYYGGSAIGGLGRETALAGEILNRSFSAEEAAEEAIRCFGPRGADPVAQALALNRLLVLAAASQGGVVISDGEVDEALKALLKGDRSLPGLLSYNSFDGPALTRLGIQDPEHGDEIRQRAGALASPYGLFPQLLRKRLSDYAAGQLTKTEFRHLRGVVAEELLLRRHAALILDAAKVTTPQLYDQFLRERTRLRLRWARAETKTFEPRVPAEELSAEKVQAFFDERKDRPDFGPRSGYQIPEKLTLELLLVDRKALQAGFPVDAVDLEAAYTADPKRWEDPATKKVRTLEEAREDLMEELTREKVLNRMDELISSAMDLSDDVPFEEAARQVPPLAYSRAELSRTAAPRTDATGMIYGLFEALRDLEAGQRLPGPLECEKGACLVRLAAREAARAPELAPIRDRVLADLRFEKAKELARRALEAVKARAAAGEDLSAAVAAVAADQGGASLTMGALEPQANPRVDESAKTPEPADRHPAAVQEAFRLKEVGETTEPSFSEDDAEALVLQLAERIDPDPSTFPGLRASMAGKYREQMSNLLLNDWLRAVETRARVSLR